MKAKYVIEITTLNTRPDNWTSSDSWPGQGMYLCDDGNLYSVTKQSVDYVFQSEPFMNHPITDDQLNPPIPEALLLKAIAAASRGEVLK